MTDQWSFLILREFFLEGETRRFQDLQNELGLSPNTLSSRLKHLENKGVLERKLYSSHPPRAEYVLTDMGRRFGPVLEAMIDWGTLYPDPTGSNKSD